MTVFDEHESAVVASLIRSSLRKLERNAARGRERYGDAYDGSRHDVRREALRSAYRKLGRDPDRISGVGGQTGCGRPTALTPGPVQYCGEPGVPLCPACALLGQR